MNLKPSTALATILTLCLPFQSLAESQKSVVRVNCLLGQGKGQMKATGFIWGEKGQMVTALHAVAGCKEIEVYSQKAKKSTVGTDLIAVDLEGDLALLKLEDDLGLEPIPHASDEPDLSEDFMTWGYPLVHKRVIGHEIEFGHGLESNITTIGKAFESNELNELFKNQSYPGKETQILRITSTIQPGHSGAPIFDENGHVVAIADGGLLGGFKGVNWSIPAHLYLPGLPSSTDEIPEEVSSWAGLFSATLPSESNFEQSKNVFSKDGALSAGQADATTPASNDLEIPQDTAQALADDYYEPEYLGEPIPYFGENGPVLYRQVMLREALAYAREWGDPSLADEIEARLPYDAFKDEIWYNVYYDPNTGATVAIPYWFTIEWNADGNDIWAYNDGESIELSHFLQLGDSFDGAMSVLYEYVDWANGYANWQGAAPADFTFDIYEVYEDPDGPHLAYHSDFYRGVEYESGYFGEAKLNVTAAENVFHGSMVMLYPAGETLSDEELLYGYITLLGVENLSQVYPDAQWAWEFDQQFADGYAEAYLPLHDLGEETDLTLVRQLSLRQALDYINYISEGAPIIEEIENYLWDDSLKDEIFYSVYEDQLTGATVAVPSWISMEWDNEEGWLWAVNASGTVEMSISVQIGDDFQDALLAMEEHADLMSEIENWDEKDPSNLSQGEVLEEDEWAYHSDYYYSVPPEGLQSTTMLMSLAVSTNVFLGSTVFLTPESDEPTDDDILEALLMEVSADYLTDFAEF